MDGDGAADVGAAEAAPESQGGIDLSPVMERLDGLNTRIESWEQSITGAQQEPEEDGEYDWGSLFPEQAAEPEQPSQPALSPDALQQAFAQAVDQAVSPLARDLQDLRLERGAEALVAEFPAMDDPEVAGAVVAAARQMAEEAGVPALATNFNLLKTIYKAQMAEKHHAGEVPVGGDKQFELERGGGAGPAAADEPNIAERIINGSKPKGLFGW